MTREEAIERIKSRYDKWALDDKDLEAIQCTFPELTESEDERIRKFLIDLLSSGVWKPEWPFSPVDCVDYLEKQKEPTDKGEVSDGYHTFNELYYYRMLYNAAFFNLLPKEWVHKSKKHHDGEECFRGGWFIVMANLPTGQISNHYELKDWELFQIPEKEVADEWDGHTPQEAADRLHKYLLEKQREQKPVECINFDNEFENQISHLIASVLSGEHEYNEGFVKYVAQSLLGYANNEQKPAEYSNEEEYLDSELRAFLCNYDKEYDDDPAVSDVAKHFYELGTRWLRQEWSEEDEKRVKQLIYDTEHIRAEYEVRKKELGESFNDELIKDCDEQIAWLKSLSLNLKRKNEDVAKLCSSEWSEEDEKMLNSIINVVCGVGSQPNGLRGKQVRFLKSLRPSTKTRM